MTGFDNPENKLSKPSEEPLKINSGSKESLRLSGQTQAL